MLDHQTSLMNERPTPTNLHVLNMGSLTLPLARYHHRNEMGSQQTKMSIYQNKTVSLDTFHNMRFLFLSIP